VKTLANYLFNANGRNVLLFCNSRRHYSSVFQNQLSIAATGSWFIASEGGYNMDNIPEIGGQCEFVNSHLLTAL